MPDLFRRRRLLTAALVLFGIHTTVFAGALPEAIGKAIKSYKVPEDAISLVVQDVDSDVPAINLNPLTPRNPASSIKLLTTFVALDVLGPTYTWPTKLYATGPISEGVLKGDLVLKGYGDPFLVVEEFWKMLGDLRARGVHTITGDLVVDDSHFTVPESDPGAFDGQPFRLYNVLPNAALVNFKVIEFQFFKANDGKSVDIRMNPNMPNVKITNNLTIKQGKCAGYNYGINMQVPDPVIADHVVFSGAFPSACRSHSLPRTMLQPGTYAYGTFKRLWTHWGGTIAGGVRAGTAPKSRPLVVWRSRPLAEIVRPLNKWSNNVMTRLLLYSLAAADFKPPYTKQQGIDVLRGYLRENDLDDTDLILDNGSGLSRETRVTAQFMNGLLRHAYASPLMPEFIASMSLIGLDGTTRRRFRGRPEAGRMHLKTGSIDNVSAIAGYVVASSGKTYSLSLMINHTNAHRGVGTEIQNAVLRWTYRQ